MPFRLVQNPGCESFVIINDKNIVVAKSLDYVDYDRSGKKVFREHDYRSAKSDFAELFRVAKKGEEFEDDLPACME